MNFSPLRSRLVFAVLLALGGLLLAFPQRAAEGFSDGLALCMNSLLPALFPFFVVCNLAMGLIWVPGILKPLSRFLGFRCEEAPALLMLSWLGGYAVCAQTVSRFCKCGKMRGRDGLLALLLGCCSGPGFVIGCVGGNLLGSVRLGVLLYLLQLAANFFSSALIVPFLPEPSQTSPAALSQRTEKISLPDAISRAVDSSLCVCGCVLFFRISYHLVLPLVPNNPVLRAFASGSLEISAGCADFAGVGGSWSVTGLCFCLSVLSFSVFAQIGTLLDGALPLWPLLLSRVLHLFWMQGLYRLCAHFLPGYQRVYSSLNERVIPMTRIKPDAAIVCLFFLCAVLYKVRKNFYNRSEFVE